MGQVPQSFPRGGFGADPLWVVAEHDEEPRPPRSAPMPYASRSVGDAWVATSSRTAS